MDFIILSFLIPGRRQNFKRYNTSRRTKLIFIFVLKKKVILYSNKTQLAIIIEGDYQ